MTTMSEMSMTQQGAEAAAEGIRPSAPSRARITDVADRAQVSIKTVSRVVNDEPGVRESTRERVLAAIPEPGFFPNTTARTLTTGGPGATGSEIGRGAWREGGGTDG